MLISELTGTDRLVLDTHIWVWTSGESGGPGQIPEAALVAIESAAERRNLFVSAASVWEIAMKAERGRALVSGDLRTWVQDQRQYPGVRVMPIDSRLSIDSTILPLWLRRSDKREHRDPADRFIVAAARRLNALVLTCDEEIVHYASQGHVAAYKAC
jgi:PIN domain nuclease of toxin-antitoxin system